MIMMDSWGAVHNVMFVLMFVGKDIIEVYLCTGEWTRSTSSVNMSK